VNVARHKSETRQLTAGVFVRFSPDDLDVLRQEAERRGLNVPQLLRETCLNRLDVAS
jgi:hypothetical protein